VPCTGIAVEPPATNGTNPQTLTNSHSACLKNTTVVVLPSDINPVPNTFGCKKEQPTKHEHSQKGSAVILTSWRYKNKLHEDQEQKET
jgi:hypothetical protein